MSNLEHIVPELRNLAVSIESLNVDAANARSHDERNLDVIANSLRLFKQRHPIVVQRQGMVVRAGNGRLAAAKKLGWTHVAAIVVDESDVQAAAFAVADNRSAELASWDFSQLSQNLEGIDWDALGADASALGFDAVEIEGMKMSNAWDEVLLDRSHIEGTRETIDSSTLVLRFTLAQKERLCELLNVTDLTSESLLEGIEAIVYRAE